MRETSVIDRLPFSVLLNSDDLYPFESNRILLRSGEMDVGGVFWMSTYELAHSPQFRRRRKVLRFSVIAAFILVVIAMLGSFGMSFYVGWNLTHPKRTPITLTPEKYHLAYQKVVFPSRVDHLHIDGWFIPADKPTDKIVIEAHGYRQNRSNDEPALPSALALHQAGFAVLMFDFRDSGVSEGQQVSVGLFEERDLLGAIDYAKSKGFHHIGLLGFSMGASTSLLAAADSQDVQAVVADSPFANLYDYLTANMPVWTHLPNWPFTPEILWEMRTFLHLDARAVDPLDKLKHWSPHPLLLIAGTADTTIPAKLNSDILYDVVKANRNDSIWLVAGAKHVGAYKVAPHEYLQRVTRFFETYLAK
jgi:uncharacterized protein